MESVLKGIKFETYDKILLNWEKYQKLYDSQNSQVSFRMVEPSKKEDGIFSMQCLARNKMGYMSSDRESLYRLQTKQIGPNKWETISITFDRDDIACSPDAVRIQYFKAG